MWFITSYTKHCTDSGKDEKTNEFEMLSKYYKAIKRELTHLYDFRVLDDDGKVYAYGKSTVNDTEEAFEPLDDMWALYGCTEIQYRNEQTGEWETL